MKFNKNLHSIQGSPKKIFIEDVGQEKLFAIRYAVEITQLEREILSFLIVIII